MDNREQRISDNIGLVHACAKRFKSRGIEYDDLFQAGCLGLVKAVDGFDEDRGVKFSTYAVPVILGEMKRLFRDGGAIKVGRALKELSLKATKETSDFTAKEGRVPTIQELAEILEVEPVMAAQAVGAAQRPISITCDECVGGGQMDIIVEAEDEKIAELLSLQQVVGTLEPRDRKIILFRYFKNQTQMQTAQFLGMTQVQVSRREKVILSKLRAKLNDQ